MKSKSNLENMAANATAAEPVVYVVDDDISVRESLGNLMRSVGLNVQLFASAQDFRRRTVSDGPTCVVLDVRLPGVSGLDLQSEMSNLGDATPLIFITGHGDVPMSVRAMKAGAHEFLLKPFREQDLLDAIHSALQKSAMHTDAASAHKNETNGVAPARASQGLTVAEFRKKATIDTSPRIALARNIQLGRAIFNWSQEELGSKCDLHRSHISALEREELSVGVDAIDRLAIAFGVPPHVLLMPPEDSQAKLLKSYNGISGKTGHATRTP